MSISATLWMGVISGVVTAALLGLLAQFVRRIGIPWYHEMTYQGVEIDGDWQAEGLSFGFTQGVELSLNQRAYSIEGTCSFHQEEHGSSEYEPVRVFKVSGTIRDRFVQLTTRHERRSRIGAGAFVLEVVNDGRVMRGVRAHYNIAGANPLTGNSITSGDVVFVRAGVRPSDLARDPMQIEAFEPEADAPRALNYGALPSVRRRRLKVSEPDLRVDKVNNDDRE